MLSLPSGNMVTGVYDYQGEEGDLSFKVCSYYVECSHYKGCCVHTMLNTVIIKVAAVVVPCHSCKGHEMLAVHMYVHL